MMEVNFISKVFLIVALFFSIIVWLSYGFLCFGEYGDVTHEYGDVTHEYGATLNL